MSFDTALLLVAVWTVLAVVAWAVVMPLLRAASQAEALTRRAAAARRGRRRARV
jgi:hypothetical protein